MSILSPIYQLDFKTKTTQVMSLILKMFILSPTNYVRFFPKTPYCSYIITLGFAPQILLIVDY